MINDYSANEIDICNDAMILIGANPIASFQENSREAELCARTYKQSVISLLSMHAWTFAIKYAELNTPASGEPFVNDKLHEYKFAYAYPDDCLTPLDLITAAGFPLSQTLPNESGFAQFNTAERIIYTNYQEVALKYISNNIPATSFPVYFREALTAKIAYMLAYNLTGVASVTQNTEYEYNQRMSRAILDDRRLEGKKYQRIIDIRRLR